MPDMDLLPDWYLRLRRSRRRLAITAAFAATALCAVIPTRTVLQRRIDTVEGKELRTAAELSDAQANVEHLHRTQALRDAMLASHEQLSQIAGHAPASWLLAALSSAAPLSVSLTDLNLDPAQPTTGPNDPADLPASTHVVVRGLAASDADVAAMQGALGRLPGVSMVSIGYAKDLAVAGRVMRAFEIGFELAGSAEKSAPGGGA